MLRKHPPFSSILAGTLACILFLSVGCASGPHYGASRKKSKSCDCPHWNKVKHRSNAAWSKVEEQGTRNGDRN